MMPTRESIPISAMLACLAVLTTIAYAQDESAPPLSGKNLGTIFNNDSNNILYALDGANSTPADYQRAVFILLDRKPGLVAQDIGMPDPVIFRSKVATTLDKYLVEISAKVWPDQSPAGAERQRDLLKKLFDSGTDPLLLTIEACRKRKIPIVASFRMNGEDWYEYTYCLSDFGRDHPEFRMSDSGNLDPAVPEVYEHRMKIFAEVAAEYDIDGIEFDFRRWYHMVSNPLENHTVLTRMVRDARKMLDETAQRKGRKKMLLGVRVGPSLNSEPNPFRFPGICYPQKPINASCKELGLDVKTWIQEGLVDYVCPSLFIASLPGMPLTREFAELAKGTQTGIYPTLWSQSAWMHGVGERRIDQGDDKALALYKYDLCATALSLYNDGADGISTFNWYSHLRDAKVPHLWTDGEGAAGSAADAVQTYVYPRLRDPASISTYLAQPWATPPPTGTGKWQPHSVRQMNGDTEAKEIPAQLQIVSEPWNRVAAVPYIVYMPEKDRVLMLVSCDYPHHAESLYSDDRGTTWSTPKGNVSTGEAAMPIGLTYLGNGSLVLFMGGRHWFSVDYGETWGDTVPVPPASNGNPWYEWDPMLVDRDPVTGKVTRLMSFGSDNPAPDGHFQGFIRVSRDEAKTWTDEVIPPEMHAVNETAFLRAADGAIVAACRTDNPEQFKSEIDHYGGLAVSISTDDGRTWSKLNTLYEWGRHHPSMVLMPNKDIVMTYVVRKGYPDTPEGLPQFGIEAVVSHDNGRSWDVAHRYVLHKWPGNRDCRDTWWPSCQATSSALMPDGNILTAFGTGYRCKTDPEGRPAPRDIGLVQWRPE